MNRFAMKSLIVINFSTKLHYVLITYYLRRYSTIYACDVTTGSRAFAS